LPARIAWVIHRFFRTFAPDLPHSVGEPGEVISNATELRLPARAEYALGFSKDVERRFLRFRASVRLAIRERLEGIATAASKVGKASKHLGRKEPPLRFYVYEGYRVVYQVDQDTRRVVVLDLGPVTS
jgi:mRNA-degrading endonuclease RelE of RelBE toxin-antitoxin system